MQRRAESKKTPHFRNIWFVLFIDRKKKRLRKEIFSAETKEIENWFYFILVSSREMKSKTVETTVEYVFRHFFVSFEFADSFFTLFFQDFDPFEYKTIFFCPRFAPLSTSFLYIKFMIIE